MPAYTVEFVRTGLWTSDPMPADGPTVSQALADAVSRGAANGPGAAVVAANVHEEVYVLGTKWARHGTAHVTGDPSTPAGWSV